MKSYGVVYLTTNKVNGKMYIGQARHPVSETYVGSGKAIKQALAKHGREAFDRKVLLEAFTKDGLDWAERQIIADLDAVKSREFYNIAPGGRSSLGFTGKKHTVERNTDISALMRERHHSAQAVKIDGKQYNSVSQAVADLPYTIGKIRRFVKTGVHPLDQVHANRGRRNIWVTGKTWTLQHEDGRKIEVTGLSRWCKENGVSYSIRDSRQPGRYVDGWKIIHP